MKKDISFSLSIQREIENHGLNVDSESTRPSMSWGSERSSTRLESAKRRLPTCHAALCHGRFAAHQAHLCSLWSGQFFANINAAQKDTYYGS